MLTILRLAIGIGLLAYLAKSGIIDLRALSKLFTEWPITLAAIVLLLFDIALMSVRLSWLFKPLGLNLSVAKSMKLTLVGFFFTTFLPGAAGGDLAKLFYAARENSGRRTEIVTIVMFDRAIGLFSLLILPLFFVPFFLPLIRSVPALRILLLAVALAAAALFAGFLICLFNPEFVNRVVRTLLRFLPVKNIPERIFRTVAGYRHSPRVLLSALGLALVANLSVVVVTGLAVLALNPASLSMKMCLVIPIGHIVNSLPITPGGLGVGEAAFGALFRLTGIRGGAEAMLCWRVWNAMVGLIGLGFYLRGIGRVVYGGENPAGQPQSETSNPESLPLAEFDKRQISVPSDQ
ncbi:MAG: lysylphosphatidylglycerol synthase transmembrane domain-containing protein [Candidatus Acidiferrales bacterium]